jgi:WD40 repeat protein
MLDFFCTDVTIDNLRQTFLAHAGRRYYIWSLLTGELLVENTVPITSTITCAALREARAFFGCSDGNCLLAPLGNNEQARTMFGHTKNVRSVHISQDGVRGISGSWDCSLRVWDLETGNVLRDLTSAHSSYVTVGRFAGRDESMLVSGSSDATMRVFDLHHADRERILSLLYKPKRGLQPNTQQLPLDVFRRIKQMLFGSSVDSNSSW